MAATGTFYLEVCRPEVLHTAINKNILNALYHHPWLIVQWRYSSKYVFLRVKAEYVKYSSSEVSLIIQVFVTRLGLAFYSNFPFHLKRSRTYDLAPLDGAIKLLKMTSTVVQSALLCSRGGKNSFSCQFKKQDNCNVFRCVQYIAWILNRKTFLLAFFNNRPVNLAFETTEFRQIALSE